MVPCTPKAEDGQKAIMTKCSSFLKKKKKKSMLPVVVNNKKKRLGERGSSKEIVKRMNGAIKKR